MCLATYIYLVVKAGRMVCAGMRAGEERVLCTVIQAVGECKLSMSLSVCLATCIY